MIPDICPLGRINCVSCPYFTTCGCTYEKINNTTNTFTTWSHDDAVRYYDKRKEELMKIPKDILVEMLIGKRPDGIYPISY